MLMGAVREIKTFSQLVGDRAKFRYRGPEEGCLPGDFERLYRIVAEQLDNVSGINGLTYPPLGADGVSVSVYISPTAGRELTGRFSAQVIGISRSAPPVTSASFLVAKQDEQLTLEAELERAAGFAYREYVAPSALVPPPPGSNSPTLLQPVALEYALDGIPLQGQPAQPGIQRGIFSIALTARTGKCYDDLKAYFSDAINGAVSAVRDYNYGTAAQHLVQFLAAVKSQVHPNATGLDNLEKAVLQLVAAIIQHEQQQEKNPEDTKNRATFPLRDGITVDPAALFLDMGVVRILLAATPGRAVKVECDLPFSYSPYT